MKERIVVRKSKEPAAIAPDLPTERAYTLLKEQLEALQNLKGRLYAEANSAEDEWFHLTARLVMRALGDANPNYHHFRSARSAGEYFMRPFGSQGDDTRQNQRTFEARQQAYESALKICLAELKLDLPESVIKGVYEPGEQYEFYRDVSACLKLAQKEIFIVDAYLGTELFDTYAQAIQRTTMFRLLSRNVPSNVMALAQKYAAGSNLEFRSSSSFHDRVLFTDDRAWVVGQSFKDAATKKPTYIVELDYSIMRPAYEAVWQSATVIL